jgi:hypothetical protein
MIETDEVLARVRGAADVLDQLSAGQTAHVPTYLTATPPRGRVRPPQLIAVMALSATIALVALLVARGGDDQPVALGSGGGPARLVLSAPGWRIIRHDEQPESGSVHFETDFASGQQRVTLHQRPPGYNDEFTNGQSITVLGVAGHLIDDGGEYRAFWESGTWDFELRGQASSDAGFRSLLNSLEYVDEATWEAALPASVVKAADRAAVVDEMLQGVPTPPGFDAARLEYTNQTSDRYQLGAQVASAILCGWIEQWLDAKQRGDSSTQDAAAQALQTSRSWTFLIDMQAEGDYPRVAWQYVDAIAGGGATPGAKVVPVEDSFRGALGCGG